MRWYLRPALLTAVGMMLPGPGIASAGPLREAGVARIDITPNYSIRLTGYASRKAESEGVAQRLWAKALALSGENEPPAILITVDNCGVPAGVRDEVVSRLQRKRGIDPARVAICSTHTHSAPWLVGFAPNIFGGPIPPEQQAKVERYTRELTDSLETVALRALADQQPATLTHGKGEARFAGNRRTKGGPTDHDLPALFVSDAAGQVRAIFASYACHCTTLTGESNQLCGDWAGFAQEYLERQHPGAVTLIALGCGADANPDPRPGLELARRHGQEMATAVDRILAQPLIPLNGKLVCRTRRIELPYDKLPTRAEWEARAKEPSYVGQHARMNLARLDRGDELPTQVPYLVQTWTFGNDLAMVFLPGEVVVDYALRLKREFDSTRIWINAYANDVPCYIPSERVLKEGGYEGGGAMIFYDKPTRLAPGVEDRIVQTVHQLVPRDFTTAGR